MIEKEDYEPINNVMVNGETIFSTREYIPSEICFEHVIGRCKKDCREKKCKNYQAVPIKEVK
jgi:hypothetical protein